MKFIKKLISKKFKKAVIPKNKKKKINITNPKILSITYNAETRRYDFNICYEQNGVQKPSKIYYRPSLKYLINDKAKKELKTKILRSYGLKAANNIDLALYSILEEFDRTYNSNYASEYGNGKLSTKLFYDFTKENKYDYMSRKNNKVANKTIHQYAKKQIFFANASIKKHNIVRTIGPVVSLTMFLLTANILKENNSTNDKEINTVSSEIIKENSKINTLNITKKEADAKSISLSLNNTEKSSVSTMSSIDNKEIITVEKPEPEEVDDLQEFRKRHYYVANEEEGFGLGEEFSSSILKDNKLYNHPSKEFGKLKAINYDNLDCDALIISEIVVYYKDEIIDRIDLTTVEKYNMHINKLYGMYGPNIKIAVNFDAYKNNKLKKENIGYINIEKISALDKETKKVLAKKHSNERVKSLALTK